MSFRCASHLQCNRTYSRSFLSKHRPFGRSKTCGSNATHWQLENKKSAKPSAELLLKLANHLGESPDYFLDDAAEKRTEAQLDDALLRSFRGLSEQVKATMLQIASGMRKREKD